MPSGATGETREVTLKRAIKAARLPARDRNLFRDLLETADWKTAILPNRFQPRNMEALARTAGVSPRTAQRAVDHLAMHGWITRTRNEKPGRQGRSVVYGFEVGEPCWCRPEQGVPLSGVDRTRRWREKKQRQIGVTNPGIQRQDAVTFDATESSPSAGQDGFGAEEGRDEGSREGEGLSAELDPWGWPEDSIGAEMNE